MTEHTKDYGQTEICLLLEKWMRKMTQWHFSFPAQNPESQSEPRSAQGLGLCPFSVFKSLYVAGVTLGGRLGDITQWYKHPALFIIQRPLLGRGAWPWPSVQGHTTALTGLAPPTPDLTPHPAPRAADGSLLHSCPEGSRSNRLIASDSKATWPFFSSDLIWPFCSCITVNPPSCLENRYSGTTTAPCLALPSTHSCLRWECSALLYTDSPHICPGLRFLPVSVFSGLFCSLQWSSHPLCWA